MPRLGGQGSCPCGNPTAREPFARFGQILAPLRLTLNRLFPTAQGIRIRLEEDPEIRNDPHEIPLFELSPEIRQRFESG